MALCPSPASLHLKGLKYCKIVRLMPSAGLFLFFLTLNLSLKDVNDGAICFF